MLWKERKWNQIRCSAKTTKGRRRMKDKNSNEEQEQQVENRNKYGR